MSPSEIALASIINALEGMFGHQNKYAVQILTAARRLNLYHGQDLSSVSHRLWELYERSEECALHNNFEPMEEEKIADETMYVSKHQDMVGDSPISVTSNKSMPSNDFMCAMRSQSVRNGSW